MNFGWGETSINHKQSWKLSLRKRSCVFDFCWPFILFSNNMAAQHLPILFWGRYTFSACPTHWDWRNRLIQLKQCLDLIFPYSVNLRLNKIFRVVICFTCSGQQGWITKCYLTAIRSITRTWALEVKTARFAEKFGWHIK